MDYYKQLLIGLSNEGDKVFDNYGEIVWVGLAFNDEEVSYRGYDRIPVLNKKGYGFSEFYKGYYSNVSILNFPVVTINGVRVNKVVLYSDYMGNQIIGEGELLRGRTLELDDVVRIKEHELKIDICTWYKEEWNEKRFTNFHKPCISRQGLYSK